MVVGQPEEHQCWGLGRELSFPDLPIPPATMAGEVQLVGSRAMTGPHLVRGGL